MAPKSLPFAHSLVLQFLELNKYHKTLNAFREEATEVIVENSDLFRRPPEMTLMEIVEGYLISRMGCQLEKLSLQRQIEDDINTAGDQKFPRYLYETFTQIHDANILTVRTQNLQLTNFVEGEYATSQVSAIVTGSADKAVRVTSLLTGDTFSTAQIHQAGVLCLDFHPHYPSLLLSGSMDSSVVLSNVTTNETIQKFNDHSKYVVHAKFSPDGMTFATASYDHTVNFYKMLPPQTPLSPKTPQSPWYPSTENVKYQKVHTVQFSGNVEAISFLPDDHLVVGVRGDNYLHYINTTTFADIKYNMNENGDDHVSFTPMHISTSPHNNGQYLLVSTDNENGRIILFRTHSSEQLRNFYGVEVDKFSTPRHCWHSSGKYIYANDDKGAICVIDVSKGKVIEKLSGHTAVVRDLWFDHERDLLISCGFDKSVRVWGPDDVTPVASPNVSDSEK